MHKSRTTRAALLLLLFISVSAQTGAPRYTGERYGPTQPKGIKYIGGALISEVNEEKEYGIAEMQKGRVRVLWFEYLTRRDDKGSPYWELKDALLIPRYPKSQILTYSFCWTNNQPDKEIVAIVDHQSGVEYFTRVRKAWRANRQTGKFEVIPTKGIKCENEGAGL